MRERPIWEEGRGRVEGDRLKKGPNEEGMGRGRGWREQRAGNQLACNISLIINALNLKLNS